MAPSAQTLLACALLGAAACGDTSTSLSVTGPTGPKCQVTVTSRPLAFGHDGGRGTLEIQAERECGWSVASEAPWISPEATRGQGSADVSYTVSANPAPASRSGRLRVDEHGLSISQEPAPCLFHVAPARADVPAAGGSVEIAVTVLSGCAWNARSDSSWLTAGVSGNGSGGVRVAASANAGAVRTGRVTVGGQVVVVEQAAAASSDGPTPPPPPGPPSPSPSPPAPPAPPPAPAPGPAPPAPSPSPQPPGQEVKLEGRATSVSGSCPALRFEVRSNTVVTDAATLFKDGSCQRLQNSARSLEVEVRGWRQPDGSVLAREVEFD